MLCVTSMAPNQHLVMPVCTRVLGSNARFWKGQQGALHHVQKHARVGADALASRPSYSYFLSIKICFWQRWGKSQWANSSYVCLIGFSHAASGACRTSSTLLVWPCLRNLQWQVLQIHKQACWVCVLTACRLGCCLLAACGPSGCKRKPCALARTNWCKNYYAQVRQLRLHIRA